eukprot:Tbor_TRINITY_DN5477_c0_g5::TRINITY_DN5477_c0_g5_i1::g.25430::m.25430
MRNRTNLKIDLVATEAYAAHRNYKALFERLSPRQEDAEGTSEIVLRDSGDDPFTKALSLASARVVSCLGEKEREPSSTLFYVDLAESTSILSGGLGSALQNIGESKLLFEFIENGILGRGISGIVRKARYYDPKECRDCVLFDSPGAAKGFIALKEIICSSESRLRGAQREIKNAKLRTINDNTSTDSLLSYYGAFTLDGSLFIATEIMENTLQSLVTAQPSNSHLPDSVLKMVLRDIVRGLHLLHNTYHIVHRDLTLRNILYRNVDYVALNEPHCKDNISLHGRQSMSDTDATYVVKIGDLGSSTAGDSNSTSFIGSFTHMSPERLRRDPYGYPSDIWSLGIIALELRFGQYPFQHLFELSCQGDPSLYQSSEAKFWTLLRYVGGAKSQTALMNLIESMQRIDNQELFNFIASCLDIDPAKRQTTQELLCHPYLA